MNKQYREVGRMPRKYNQLACVGGQKVAQAQADLGISEVREAKLVECLTPGFSSLPRAAG